MALIRSPALIFTVFTAVIIFSSVGSCDGRMVGGRSEVRDVKTNKEVQEIGRFSVEEYNRKRSAGVLRAGGGGGEQERLRFLEVVAAEKQVVAGIKYYLKVSVLVAAGDDDEATPSWRDGGGGRRRKFDSVVVVKPWLKSKQLLGFAPADDLLRVVG